MMCTRIMEKFIGTSIHLYSLAQSSKIENLNRDYQEGIPWGKSECMKNLDIFRNIRMPLEIMWSFKAEKSRNNWDVV